MSTARKLFVLCASVLGLLVAPVAASAAERTETFTVPTGQIGPYEVKQDVKAFIPTPSTGGYITKMETDIVDATTGDPVPISRLMLHHIVFANIGATDSTCTDFLGFDSQPSGYGFAPQRFFAAGEERAKMSMPTGYGYPMAANAYWGMIYMVMNHRNATDNALIQYKVTYEDDPVGQGMQAVTPWWLDVKDCKADPIYNVPGVKPEERAKAKAKDATYPVSKDYTIPYGGRIVAGAGHVHGGARKLTLTQPDCGNRQVAESNPTWGLPDHPFYQVRPVLHEPGPINMSAFQAPTGIPVGAGGKIRLNSLYDNSLPHVRVMGIFIVYIANDAAAPACGPLPGDTQTFSTNQPGRTGGPIPFTIPLTGLDANGNAITIKKPPGKLKRAKSGSTTQVKDRFFGRRNIEVKKGATLNWQFSGNEIHNLTLANGPLGIGSDNLNGSRSFTQKFNRTGTYRFFCGLHPVQMSQRVVVKGKKKRKHKK